MAKTATRQAAEMRAVAHTRYVADLAEGRRQRAVTIPARKGAGSYRRRPKHGRITD